MQEINREIKCLQDELRAITQHHVRTDMNSVHTRQNAKGPINFLPDYGPLGGSMTLGEARISIAKGVSAIVAPMGWQQNFGTFRGRIMNPGYLRNVLRECADGQGLEAETEDELALDKKVCESTLGFLKRYLKNANSTAIDKYDEAVKGKVDSFFASKPWCMSDVLSEDSLKKYMQDQFNLLFAWDPVTIDSKFYK